MSAVIRQQLEPILLSLLGDRANLQGLLDLADDQENLVRLGSVGERLARRINSAQSLLGQWTSLLGKPELADAEQAAFDAFRVSGVSPGQILFEAQEAQAAIDIKVDLIRAAARHAAPPTAPAKFHLPDLQLPTFDGKDASWPTFWAAFRHTIDENAGLTGAQKLTFLVGRLTAQSRPLVEGFALTDDNYPIVIDMLKSRYGDDAKRAERLRSELFHLPKPTSHSHSLRAFSEDVDRICRQLEGLGTPMGDNPFLTVAIKEKLPLDLKAQLLDKEMEGGGPWTSGEWRERLSRAVRVKEALHPLAAESPVHHTVAQPSARHNPVQTNRGESIRRAFPVVGQQSAGGSQRCSLCLQAGHRPLQCPTYKTPEDRKRRLVAQGRCWICAREGHPAENCSSTGACHRCQGKHHVLVCATKSTPGPSSGANAQPLGISQRGPSRPFLEGPTQLSAAVIPPSKISGDMPPPVYLMVRDVVVYNHLDPEDPLLATLFFDPGSQPDFISSKLAAQIAAPCLGEECLAVGGFQGGGPAVINRFKSPRLSVNIQREDGGWETMTLNCTPKIVPSLEFMRESPWGLPHKMASGEPEILLGMRHFWRCFRGISEIGPNLFRIDTVFGPVLCGEGCPSLTSMPVALVPMPLVCGVASRGSPDEMVKQLWSLESIGIKEAPGENEDELAMIDFKKTVQFKEGRFHVGWPWRPGCRERLSNNFGLAYSRLAGLAAKFKLNPGFRDAYVAAFKDQLDRGVIEPANRCGAGEHFIPHHAVVNPKKVRIVYDASAHEKGGLSLNDALMAGPNLIADLAGILLRFRMAPFPVLADLAKAFWGMGLNEEDRERAKLLWLKDPTAPISPSNLTVYRFTRVLFGAKPAPFLLVAVLQHLLELWGDPLGMGKNLFMDNLFLPNDTVQEAAKSVHIARDTMDRGDSISANLWPPIRVFWPESRRRTFWKGPSKRSWASPGK